MVQLEKLNSDSRLFLETYLDRAIGGKTQPKEVPQYVWQNLKQTFFDPNAQTDLGT